MSIIQNDTLKKSLAVVGLSTGMVLSGLGIAQVASAQTDEPATTESTESEAVESEATESESSENERDGDCDGKRHRRGGFDKEAVAEALGMTTDELRAEFEAGNSLADVAAAQDVDVQDLIDMMVAEATEHINEKVAEGDMTQEEADEKMAELTDRITERVNSVPDADGEGGPRGERGNRGDRGPRGERGGDADADA